MNPYYLTKYNQVDMTTEVWYRREDLPDLYTASYPDAETAQFVVDMMNDLLEKVLYNDL